MSTPRPAFLPASMPGFRARVRRRRVRTVRAIVLLPVHVAMVIGRMIGRAIEASCR